MKTAYIISYSLDKIRSNDPYYHALLDSSIPPALHELATLYCTSWTPPPPSICAQYSGVSRRVQDIVMRDPRARRGVADGIEAVLRAFDEGMDRVVLLTVCWMGTHRSVSAAEVIGRELGRRRGVRVCVRHPHRRRGVRDAY